MKTPIDWPPRDTIRQNTEKPSLWWRSASYGTLLSVSVVSRAFLYLFNQTEVHGLPKFLDLIKSRSEPSNRQRGLITVSNHISVVDDPLIWGVLPLSFPAYHGYMNHRWTLGSHDICFKGPFRSHFFTLGQVLPTHRLAYSPSGGPEQATIIEAIRLLSKIDRKHVSYTPAMDPRFQSSTHIPSWPRDCIDPFSDVDPAPCYPSQQNDERYYLQPSRYACNSFSWIHIFPEGMTHQSEDKITRYFKWGVARLILEAPECPDIVPMFIEGTDKVMHESRGFPRFLPRIGKKVTVTFGDALDAETRFGDLRKQWRELVVEDAKKRGREELAALGLGLLPQELAHSPRVLEIRRECTKRVREEVLKVRKSRGYPDEDPKYSLVETWMKEGPNREGQMEDGTWIKDT